MLAFGKKLEPTFFIRFKSSLADVYTYEISVNLLGEENRSGRFKMAMSFLIFNFLIDSNYINTIR